MSPDAPPPAIPGFEPVGLLGRGGFSNVYRYRQLLPRRDVAVKVLRPGRHTDLRRFTAEANAMAMLSDHPAIVTVLQAGIADDSRLYIAMEYCPGPNLQERLRDGPLSVADALSTMIATASAVETAHRAGILHHDIKPANILLTAYGRPALTDFGVAVSADADSDAPGLSVPWAPPEVVGDGAFGVVRSGTAADVYQLAATLYTALAARSPFEVVGGDNASGDLIARIIHDRPQPLGRTGVPTALLDLLERSLDKDPAGRPASAAAFARELQRVQVEMGWGPTPLDIRSAGIASTGDGPLGSAGKPVASRRAPEAAGGEARLRRRAGRSEHPPTSGPSGRTTRDPRTEPDGEGATIIPDDDAAQSEGDGDDRSPVRARAVKRRRPGRRRAVGWVAIGVLGAGIAAVVVPGVVGAGGGAEREVEQSTSAAPQAPIVAVPSVTELTGAADGGDVVFRWTNPDPRSGDSYLWRVAAVDGAGELQRTDDATATVVGEAAATAEKVCIEVILRREDGSASEPAVACVEP